MLVEGVGKWEPHAPGKITGSFSNLERSGDCDGLGEGFGGQGGNTLPRFLAPCMISVRRSYVLSPFLMGRP